MYLIRLVQLSKYCWVHKVYVHFYVFVQQNCFCLQNWSNFPNEFSAWGPSWFFILKLYFCWAYAMRNCSQGAVGICPEMKSCPTQTEIKQILLPCKMHLMSVLQSEQQNQTVTSNRGNAPGLDDKQMWIAPHRGGVKSTAFDIRKRKRSINDLYAEYS